MEELIKEMNLKQINIEGDFIINKHQLKEFAEKYQALQLQQTGVSSCCDMSVCMKLPKCSKQCKDCASVQ